VAGADHYLEVGFTSGAGSIAAGGSSGEIQNRFNKSDWSNYNENDDWSFGTNVTYADAPHVTLYQNGTLVWGTEPCTGCPTNTPLPPTSTPGPTNTTGPTPTATKTNTPGPTPTNTTGPTPTKTNTPAPSPTPCSGCHLANPFAGATWYVNPDWAAEVNASTVTASQKNTVSHLDTAVWLDSMGSLTARTAAVASSATWMRPCPRALT